MRIHQLILSVAITVVLFFMSIATAISHQQDIRIGVLAKRGENIARVKWEPTGRYLESVNADLRFRLVPLGFDEIIPAGKKKSPGISINHPNDLNRGSQ